MLDRILRLSAPLVLVSAFAVSAAAQTASVSYELYEVLLDPTSFGASQMLSGSFTWTYQVGDFENGSGQFTSLQVPWSGENLATLNTNVDLGSIEITLPGSFHDRGVDISLKLLQDLNPDTPSAINLVLSSFEIQEGSVHQGVVATGEIVQVGLLPVLYGAGTPGSGGAVPTLATLGNLAHLGSSIFGIRADNVLGGTSGFVLVGFGQTSIPTLGVELLVSPVNLLSFPVLGTGTAGLAGDGSMTALLPIPNNPSLAGIELDLQVLALDAGSPGGLLSATPALSTLVFP